MIWTFQARKKTQNTTKQTPTKTKKQNKHPLKTKRTKTPQKSQYEKTKFLNLFLNQKTKIFSKSLFSVISSVSFWKIPNEK